MVGRQRKKTKGSKLLRIIILSLLLVLFFILFKNLGNGFWDGENKLSLVVSKPEFVEVIIFDPKPGSMTTIRIPGNTEVEVSRGLGTWKLGSVWQLSIDQGKTGYLLSETVTKNFMFPAYLWAGGEAEGFTKGDLKSVLGAVFAGYKTNVGLFDRVKIGLFALGVKNTNRINVNLEETSLLKETKLKDGVSGFTISGKVSEKLLSFFSDNEVSDLNLRMQVVDFTGKPQVAQKVGAIVEVLGPKVASISKEDKKDFDCVISAKKKFFGERVARFFNCSQDSKPFLGNFDLKIELGEKFAERF